jgi:hypothetical protein
MWNGGAGSLVTSCDERLGSANSDDLCAQERRRKWDGFASGETLFGLPVTAHPELQRTAEELSMLGRLYGLYRAVIDTIRGYGDYLWSSVVSQVLGLCTATRATVASQIRHWAAPRRH